MQQPGYTVGNDNSPRPGRGFPWGKALLAAGALATVFALTQCHDEPEPLPTPPPPPDRVLEPWETDLNAIYISVDTRHNFHGAAGQNALHADRAASDKCTSTVRGGNQCYAVMVYDATRHGGTGKACGALGVDFFTRASEARRGEQRIAFTSATGATPDAAQAAIDIACAKMPQQCAFGTYVACNYDPQ